jgi:hypothetical protein
MNNSVTVDEYAHLPAGAAYWKHREFSIYNLSPPLLRFWAAAPAMLAGADAPPALPLLDQSASSRHWTYAQWFMDSNRTQYQHLYSVARLGMIPLSCWAAWVIFRWAGALYGPRAGVMSSLLYCLDPNILAHGSLVTTDVGTAAALVTAAWLWWRFCRRPRPARLTVASIAVAAAILCKFSALLLWPAIVLVALLFVIVGRQRWSRMLIGVLVCAQVCLLLVNLAYGYHRTGLPLRQFDFQSESIRSWAARLPGWLPVPVPDFFMEGVDTQKLESGERVPAFALGQYYVGSRWYYYPLTLACKLPLTMLTMLVLALASIAAARPRFHEWIPLIVLLVFALGTVVFADMNIGIRHLLPAMPLLYVFAGRLSKMGALAIAIMALLLAIEVIPTGPNFLSFFNRAVGGPSRAQFILNDSNFDWGQGLLALRQWTNSNRVDRIGLAYFGRVDPAIYGIGYAPLTAQTDTDLVGVSSFFLVGMPQRVRIGPDQFSGWVQLRDAARWRELRPVAVVDRVITIYRRYDVEQLLGPGPLLVPFER